MPEYKKYGFILASLPIYIWLCYYVERTWFFELLIAFGLLLGIYAIVIRKIHFNSKQIIIAALVLRIVVLFSTPNLSDDYFRFVWDGQLSLHGQNPFLSTPDNQQFSNPEQQIYLQNEIQSKLNSPHYYSVYPPADQIIFVTAAALSNYHTRTAVIIMKLMVLLAELGTIILLTKLLKHAKFKPELAAIHAFNPIVIVELTGNLHMEAVMIFFMFLAIYGLVKHRIVLSAIAFAIAISTKLWPLMFLPLLIRPLGLKESFKVMALTGVTLLLLWFPFYNSILFADMEKSIELYFQKFEFNAGMYNILRSLGYYFTGYNQIAIIGKITPIVVLLFVIIRVLRYKKEELLRSWHHDIFWVFTVYLMLASIVHPWYIVPLLAFSLFTKYRFAYVWSALAVLSYFAYSHLDYHENYWLLAVEYITVLIVMIIEISGKKITVLSDENQ